MKVGIISDTHGHIDKRILEHFKDCQEIWHAGDIGSWEVIDALKEIAPLKVVYGNIDGGNLKWSFQEDEVFTYEVN